MNWYRNLSFRRKLIYPSIVLALIVIFSAIVGLNNVNSLEDKANQVALEYLPGQNLLIQADRDLYQAQVAERSMIFIPVSADSYQELIKQHIENIEQSHDRVNKYGALTTSGAAKQKIKKFNELFATWKATTLEISNQRTNHGRTGRTTAIDLSFGEGAEQFNNMRDVIDQLTQDIEVDAENAVKNIENTATEANQVQITALVISIIICLLFIFILPTFIAKPLKLLVDKIEDIIQGDGDLASRVELTSKDELGQFAQAFNGFLDNLHRIISEVVGSTERLTISATELSNVSTSAKAGLEQQQMATDMVVTAVNEMAATVQEVAQNTTLASDSAQAADQNTTEGQNIIQQTIEVINELAEDINSAEDAINQLEQDSQNIGGVLDVIQNIAEQTNLLALNAAIEAARAGEQGRGFAVVADEVRSLAAKTQQSTEEIQKMINALQSGSKKAVEAISIGNEKVIASVGIVGKAEDALKNITGAVTQISDMSVQIAAAVEEQHATTEEIKVNVQSIAQESTSSLQNSEKIADSSDELSALADNLNNIVGNFKL